MYTRVLPLGPKPGDYYQRPRDDVIGLLPRPLGAVLDIGCGAGEVGRALRAAGALRLVGVEIDPQAAELARKHYDVVIAEDALAALPASRELGPFDTIVCYDILEHLYDPAALLAGIREFAQPGARLHVSVPNARHASLFRDLYLKGTFGYTTWGHRDSTHIRWFTRRDITELLEECGWAVTRVETHRFKRSRQVATSLTAGLLRDFFAVQWFVLAEA